MKYERAGSGAFRAVPGVPAPNGPVVLVVDDDADIPRLLGTMLAGAGINTIAAYDGMQGFIVAQKEHPQLIFVDLHLPAGGGLRLLEKLKTNPKTATIPVVVLTGDDSADLPERTLALGARAFLLKPLDPARLHEVVTPFLG